MNSPTPSNDSPPARPLCGIIPPLVTPLLDRDRLDVDGLGRVRELHARVMQISTTIYAVGRYGSAYLKGLESALSCLGICDDYLAEPFQRFGPVERERIEAHLRDLGLSREGQPARAGG